MFLTCRMQRSASTIGKEGGQWEFIYRKTVSVFQSGGGTKELEAGISRLQKNQEEIKAAVASAQDTAAAAKSAAEAARGAADTANTNAVNAQNAANAANTNAVNAQNTANTAKSSAASAQNTANAALPKNYVTDAKNMTDNSRAMSAKENNAGVPGSLRSRVEEVAAERPAAVYDAYKTDEYVCGNDSKLLASLQLQHAGVYLVTGGIRYDTNANGTIHANSNLNMFLGASNTAGYQEDYRCSNGTSIPEGYQICHLGTSGILTVQAGGYVNLGLFGPPVKILRTWIRAVLLKKN